MQIPVSRHLRTWWGGRPGIVGLLGGMLCGLVVLGLGGRLAMSAIAVAIGVRVQWDFAGTMQVVILGTGLGPPAGVAYVALERHLPGGRVTRGFIFGAAYLAVLTALYFLRPAGPIELDAAPFLGSFLFGGLVVVFGATLALTVGWLDKRLPASHTASSLVGALVFALIAGSLTLALFALVSR